jgi:hypothetical protein
MTPFLLLILIASGASAQSANPDLTGLKGVDLGLVLQHDTQTRLGLTNKEAYQAIAEELRKAGIKFLPLPARNTDLDTRFQKMPKDYAMLYFEVVAVVGARMNDNYALDIRYDLLDRVRLSRDDNSKETVASILTARHVVLLTGHRGGAEVLDRLRGMTKQFAAHFRAANPETNKR